MTAPGAGEDAAWASVELPLDPVALYAFLGDTERLFRINPLLDLDRVAREDDDVLRLAGRNESNGEPFDVSASVVERIPGRCLVIRYDAGIKRETRFEIEPAAAGSALIVTETYDTPAEGDREIRLRQVDRSLIPWVAALRDHLRSRARWGWLPGHAWYLERFWLAMAPRQRRIVRLLVWVTALEFVAFLLVFAIWWNETRGG